MEKLKLYGEKNTGGKEFLGTIYVNEKKEIVIDVKDPQVKEDIAKKINEKIEEKIECHARCLAAGKAWHLTKIPYPAILKIAILKTK